MSEPIRVIARIRPPHSFPSTATSLSPPSSPPLSFDAVLTGPTSEVQREVSGVVAQFLQGYNGCVLAYGQTGSGKTHTVVGDLSGGEGDGVLGRSVGEVFEGVARENQRCEEESARALAERAEQAGQAERGEEEDAPSVTTTGYSFRAECQFLEVYGEDVRCLLSGPAPTPCPLRDLFEAGAGGRQLPTGDVEVIGAARLPVPGAQRARELVREGMRKRATGATAMNDASSRSHAIFTLFLEQTYRAETESGERGEETQTSSVTVRRSHLNFVDLAGSERQKRTQATGRRMREGISINKGLLVLGNVIAALADRATADDRSHVPFRESKLTRILRTSLSGNSKTLFIAAVSGAPEDADETLCCLRYATRVKSIEVRAVANETTRDSAAAMVHRLTAELGAVAADLLRAAEGGGGGYYEWGRFQ
ncbi:hypothetical protein TeGR_g9041, partial [Tetraparma gracilis]